MLISNTLKTLKEIIYSIYVTNSLMIPWCILNSPIDLFLVSQDVVEENSKPLFILSPFKDGIFSVEFHSSIQLIQAFSIGIAILNSSRKDDVFIDAASENSKFTNRAADEVSADYVWNPPLSPFGRV